MKEFSVNSGFLYGVTAVVIIYVLAQSVFFLVRASKRAKELGIQSSVVKRPFFPADCSASRLPWPFCWA